MDLRASSRVADPADFPGVDFGLGVVIYGNVHIGPGSHIGDYSVIGVPVPEELREDEGSLETRIGDEVCIGSHCVIHAGATLGRRVLLQDHCSLGSECVIGEHSRILYAAQIHWRVNIGERCVVGGFCCDRAVVGDDAVMLGKLIHRLDDPFGSWDEVQEPSPVVEAKAVIGFDALIIGGITARSGAYVAAGAIVTGNVAAESYVVGTTHYTPAEWQTRKDSD